MFKKNTKESTMSQGYTAFTLAEVLITLGIIGVVAAMTIPTLMNNIQDQQSKSGAKKAYSTLSQAYSQILMENSGSVKDVFVGDNLGSEPFKNAFASYLKVVKNCSGIGSLGGSGTGSSAEGCWHKANEWKELGGTLKATANAGGLVLSDGTLIYFEISNSDCSFNMVPYNGNFKRCGFINVDINGFKKPNVIGKDIFNFNVLQDKILPEGAVAVDTSNVCSATSTDGWSCTYKYVME